LFFNSFKKSFEKEKDLIVVRLFSKKLRSLFFPKNNKNSLTKRHCPDYVIGFVMSVAIARKSGCLEILA
tara:strand:+ start:1127 stop:1333 length:207 start_codon:yes stop_codon:yes gene_type:complete